MEYLNSITDKLKYINEENIEYIDLFETPELFYGSVNFTSTKLDFSLFPPMFQEDLVNYDEASKHEWLNMNDNSCGNRLRFSTSSKRIIFKIKLRRKWPYQKIINWNSMGFDVYTINNNKYVPFTVFAPVDGNNIFAELINVPKNSEICIFLPTFNSIESFYLGIEKNSSISSLKYPKMNQLPVIFYGNSITQGAAASKSGNTFSNIVSRKLNRDIINFSCSSCCKGEESIAELIGKINCHSIVIDYTRNASDTNSLKKTHKKFYNRIRDFHPDKKIVLLTSACYNNWDMYYDFDQVVIDTYVDAKNNGDDVELIHQRDLFNKSEYDYVAIDTSHYTDYGMFKMANKLCEILNKV